MIGLTRFRSRAAGAVKAAALAFALAGLAACTASDSVGGQAGPAAAPLSVPPATAASEPETPPPVQAPPPPVDLAGRWRLSAAGGGGCFMTLGGNTGATAGTIAPAGGCPGNFFTSRKWTYEHDALIIRDYKGQELVELPFTGGHFEGKDSDGGAITLARP